MASYILLDTGVGHGTFYQPPLYFSFLMYIRIRNIRKDKEETFYQMSTFLPLITILATLWTLNNYKVFSRGHFI